jgi:pimeloyl-ACP methyl ester carboxylesterase
VLPALSGEAPELASVLVGDSGFLEVLPRTESLPAWLTEDDLAAFTGHFADNDFAGPLNWYRNHTRNWDLTAAWANATITPPALFLAGDRDPVVHWGSLDRLETRLRRRVAHLERFELLPGAGHWVQQERPEETSRVLALSNRFIVAPVWRSLRTPKRFPGAAGTKPPVPLVGDPGYRFRREVRGVR